MKSYLSLALAVLSLSLFSPAYASAQIAAGVVTDGSVYLIDTKTGATTPQPAETIGNFSLGGFTRRNNKIYYVAVPSDSSENALFTLNLGTGAGSHVDLDRSEEVRDLFFNGRKLYGIFYDGMAGSLGVYRIAPATGATTLVLDLAPLGSIDPIGGSIAYLDGFFYTLVHKADDYSARQLLRFKTKANSATLTDVLSATDATPVRCERLKPNALKSNFVCLASNLTDTEVSVCKLTKLGKAACGAPLSGIERVAGGHTMMTPNNQVYHALVYAPGDPDNQRLIKFNAKGVVKSTLTIPHLFIGADFKPAPTPSPAP